MNWVLDFAVRATILLAIGLGLRWVAGKSSAEKRVTILRATLAALVALPLAMLFLPSTKIPILQPRVVPTDMHVSEIADTVPTQPVSTGAYSPVFDENPAQSTVDYAEVTTASTKRIIPWQKVAFNLWIGIASLLLVTTILRLFQVANIRRRSAIGSPQTAELCQSAMERLNIRSRVNCRYAKVGSPLTFGVLSHTILLPYDFENWSEADREAVMLHEAAHIRRFDCAWQWLSAALRAVYWCHPLVWSASRALRDDSELAADERAVRSGISATDYAASLIAIARNIQQQRVLVQPQGVTFMHQDQLERRVHNILHSRRRGFSSLGLLALCGAILGAGALVGTAHFTVAKAHMKDDAQTTMRSIQQPEVDVLAKPEVISDEAAIATTGTTNDSAKLPIATNVLPDSRAIVYQESGVDYEALFNSITAAQKKLLKTRGFLFVSDLSVRQRAIVGTLPGKDFSLQMKYRSQGLTIKPDPINNTKYFAWDAMKKKYVPVSPSQVRAGSGVVYFAWDPKQKVYVPVTSTRTNPFGEPALAPSVSNSISGTSARAGGRNIPPSSNPYSGRTTTSGKASSEPMAPVAVSSGSRNALPGEPIRATTGGSADAPPAVADVVSTGSARPPTEHAASNGGQAAAAQDAKAPRTTVPASKEGVAQAGPAGASLPAGVATAGTATTVTDLAPAAGPSRIVDGVTIHSNATDSGNYTVSVDKGVLTLRNSNGSVKRWKVPSGISVTLYGSGKIKVFDKNGKLYDLSKHEIK